MSAGFASRDLIACLQSQSSIASEAKKPGIRRAIHLCHDLGFLQLFGPATLRDLPDLEAMTDAGLLQVLEDPVLGLLIVEEG